MDGARTPAVILSGGRSSRMGGGNKSLLEIAGRNLLARSIERLRPRVGSMAINANGDHSLFMEFGLPIIADMIPGYAGPLAGVLAAMAWSEALGGDSVVTVAGDTPFFPRDLVQRLTQARAGEPARIAVASSDGRRHPVFALWPVMLRAELEKRLAVGGSGRVDDFIATNPFVEVDFSAIKGGGFDPFFNINTPDDLKQAALMAKMDDR